MEGPGIHPQLAALAVPIDSLTPLEKNPNVGDVEALRRLLRRFGQRRPATVRHLDDGRTEITAGNTLWRAAKAEGWTEPAVLETDDDDQTAVAWTIGDNRSRDLAHTNTDLLDELLLGLARDAPELVTTSGYDLDTVLADLARDPADPVRDYTPFDHGDPGPQDPDSSVPNDPPAGDEGLRVVLTFGDLRAKVSRAAYAQLYDRLLREHGTIAEAGRGMALELDIDPSDVVIFART